MLSSYVTVLALNVLLLTLLLSTPMVEAIASRVVITSEEMEKRLRAIRQGKRP